VIRSLLALTLALPLAGPAEGADPRGLWWVEGGAARVLIEDCPTGVCGRVVWLRSPFGTDGCALRDVENPDEDLSRRPVMGMTILEGLRRDPDRPGVWHDGRIYDPGSGRAYHVVVSIVHEDQLRVRGYVGFELLGRTTTWFRVGREGSCAGP